jgi:cell division protein FtsW (lipid II flippase)
MSSSWTADNRLRPLVWLLAAATAQIIAFWYPFYAANRYPSSDRDGRYFILPEIVFVAAGVAILSVVILFRRTRGHSKLSTVGLAGLALAACAIALWPAWRIMIR